MMSKSQCEKEIYDNGEGVAYADMPKYMAEAVAIEASRDTGQRVDWHYVGGRAVFLVIGDVEKVKNFLENNVYCRIQIVGLDD
jgi:hypothetical protein